MDFLIFSLSLMIIYIGLAQLLHVQFGITGIPNFGVVGFWGIGLYGTGVLYVTYDFPLLIAIILAALLSAVMAYILAVLVLQRNGQAVLAATLAFAALVADLVISEKHLTNGVKGLGTINMPLGDFEYRNLAYFLFLLVLVIALAWWSAKLRDSRLGRQLIAIRDNDCLLYTSPSPRDRG